MDTTTLPPEVVKFVCSLQNQIQKLVEETNTLRQRLGIRNYLNPNPQTEEEMDSSDQGLQPPSTREKKPPPFFVNGVKSTATLSSLLMDQDVILKEMKALSNGDIKIQPITAEDYRTLRKMLNCPELRSDASKKKLGELRYHMYLRA